jgi:hypothetical protein
MTTYVNLERIAELQDVMGSEPGAIVASMTRTMTAAIDEVEAALGAGELDRATQAAHLCRNDALMLGAKPLLDALTELEAATRDHDESRAREGLEKLRAVWPATREQLAEAGRKSQPPQNLQPRVKSRSPGDD